MTTLPFAQSLILYLLCVVPPVVCILAALCIWYYVSDYVNFEMLGARLIFVILLVSAGVLGFKSSAPASAMLKIHSDYSQLVESRDELLPLVQQDVLTPDEYDALKTYNETAEQSIKRITSMEDNAIYLFLTRFIETPTKKDFVALRVILPNSTITIQNTLQIKKVDEATREEIHGLEIIP